MQRVEEEISSTLKTMMNQKRSVTMDRRDTAHRERWWGHIDKHRMVTTVTILEDDDEGDYEEDIEAAIEFEVCDLCNGKGTHVNPSIDSHGLSADDFAEDPDFAESYFSGGYDVRCALCQGDRVVPVLVDDEIRAKVEAVLAANREIDQMMEAERRMGA